MHSLSFFCNILNRRIFHTVLLCPCYFFCCVELLTLSYIYPIPLEYFMAFFHVALVSFISHFTIFSHICGGKDELKKFDLKPNSLAMNIWKCFLFSVGIGGFVIGLSQISFFSWKLTCRHINRCHICFNIKIYPCVPITLNECHAWFYWYGLHRDVNNVP